MSYGLQALVGFQILFMDEEYIVVAKNKEIFVLTIEDDEGDCCGYNEITTDLIYGAFSKHNPVITKVTIENEEIDEGQYCSVCFFGGSKLIGNIDTYSSSGSGWGYGATVTVRCKRLDINDILSSW